MSPVAASQDQTGQYTRKWVPELSMLAKPLLHKPWEAPKEILLSAGVVLGETYPHRIVSDLQTEREKSVINVLNMRRNSQQFNDEKGYDIVTIPTNGEKTVLFTKKEYRINRKGDVIISTRTNSKSTSQRVKRGRGRKGKQKPSMK